jgi:hypothetical protein
MKEKGKREGEERRCIVAAERWRRTTVFEGSLDLKRKKEKGTLQKIKPARR